MHNGVADSNVGGNDRGIVCCADEGDVAGTGWNREVVVHSQLSVHHHSVGEIGGKVWRREDVVQKNASSAVGSTATTTNRGISQTAESHDVKCDNPQFQIQPQFQHFSMQTTRKSRSRDKLQRLHSKWTEPATEFWKKIGVMDLRSGDTSQVEIVGGEQTKQSIGTVEGIVFRSEDSDVVGHVQTHS